MRESIIETKVWKYAVTKGFFQCKFTSPGLAGVPDRLFIRRANVFFVEFKATGEKPSALQRLRMREIERQGIRCYVIDNIDDGKKLIDQYA